MSTIELLSAEELFWMPGDQPWKLWEGKLRKVPGSGGVSSAIGANISVALSLFVRPRNLGIVTGAKGGYILQRNPDTVLLPDVAFVRWERIPGRMILAEFCPFPPDLAAEVLTFWNVPGDVEAKTSHYRKAGVPLLWWVAPDDRTVSVFRHGELAAVLGDGDTLDGENVPPGLSIPVSEIFE
jgi:Uma2 family endonuclease